MKNLIIALVTVLAASTSQATTICFDAEGSLAKIEFNEQVARFNWNLRERGAPQNIETAAVSQFVKQGSAVSFIAFFNGISDASQQRITIQNGQISFENLFSNGNPAGNAVTYNRVYCK